MTTHKPADSLNDLVDHAAASADHAIQSTQRIANETLNSLSGRVQDLRDGAEPMFSHSGEQIGAMAQRGAQAMRDSSRQLREKALGASDSAVTYIKEEPVKAMLIAAATGAALMALLSLMARSRRP
jgi:ElaB/YqjD/DUF883 family membrane-anchored ribosome-binding protein